MVLLHDRKPVHCITTLGTARANVVILKLTRIFQMVQFLLPKLHRAKRRMARKMRQQQQLLDDMEHYNQAIERGVWNNGVLNNEAGSSTPMEGVAKKGLVGDGMVGDDEVGEVCPPELESATSHLLQHAWPQGVDQCMSPTLASHNQPGPMPGMRPSMGGAGGMVPPPQSKGSGAMGIIMPLYTVGIVVFFVYTIMKVLFKKGADDEKTPKLKDFGMDPEYRKYVFAEEYLDNSQYSSRDQQRRQARDESRARKKVEQEVQPDPKIGKPECEKKDEQLDQLRQRLEDTEKAMERLMCQMGSVTDKLTAAKITEVLSQAQAQAKILKDEVGVLTSEDDLTSSEALTATLSEDNSLPASLQQQLHKLQADKSPATSKGSSPDMDEYEVVNKDEGSAPKPNTTNEVSSVVEPETQKTEANSETLSTEQTEMDTTTSLEDKTTTGQTCAEAEETTPAQASPDNTTTTTATTGESSEAGQRLEILVETTKQDTTESAAATSSSVEE